MNAGRFLKEVLRYRTKGERSTGHLLKSWREDTEL
jgi:hypothetical protein